MRLLLALIFLGFASAAWALETARGLAASGAPHLALGRVEQLQPHENTAPRWAEWEALRLALLVDLKRNDEVLKRAAVLPGNLPPALQRSCLLSAARAAVATGQGARARAYAARVLWQLEPDAAEKRGARLLVIDSYLADRQGDAAFHAMLRFEQDYRPLEPVVAGHFTEALLDLGLDREAVSWLASLADTSAVKLRLRLRAGLIGADAAIAQARARLAPRQKRQDAAGYWLVLAEAAQRKGDDALRIEALERLLDRAVEDDGRTAAAQANGLWEAYQARAQALANRSQMLAGDDKAWSALAARRLGANAVESRALFAYLARNGRERETRFDAQHQLAFSLYQGGLDHAALHLFGDAGIAVEMLDPKVRHLLGEIAAKRDRPALAVHFWQELAAPSKTDAQEWQVRLAEAQWRSGAADAAVSTLRAMAKSPSRLSRPATVRVLALSREATAAGQPAMAEEMVSAVVPLAAGNDARVLLNALGGIAESAAQFARAADYFLRTALPDGSPVTDALALQARLAAATNLARAGYREDARAQFQWVIANSKDASQRELARRELARF
jgi:hypothetical protein